MSLINRQIQLCARPEGAAGPQHFALVEQAVPPLQAGQVLVRQLYLSIDPYMRGRMSAAKSYAAPQPLHQVMLGATVGEVLQSQHPDYTPGAKVLLMGGWQELALIDATQPQALRLLPEAAWPLSYYLGALGMPGVTAWYGLTQILQLKPGQTLLVSAASGAVGSVVGQLARRAGVRVLGIAGGADKCRYVVDELGFEACLDHRQYADAPSLSAALAQACPQGVDGVFENVGGACLEAALRNINAHGRIALCGLAAGYDGQPLALHAMALLLSQRVRVQGFIITEHLELWPQALAELQGLMARGELKVRESVVPGLEAAPAALLGLLKGANFGKQIVKLA